MRDLFRPAARIGQATAEDGRKGFARRAGVDPGNLQAVLTGRRAPSQRMLAALEGAIRSE